MGRLRRFPEILDAQAFNRSAVAQPPSPSFRRLPAERHLGVPAVTIDTELHRLLTEIAYLGCVTNQGQNARRVLEGLEAAAPGAREVVIGQALVLLTDNKPDAAADALEALASGGDPHGVVFRALALRLAARSSEADATLARLVPGDATADALAASLRGTA